MSQDDLAGLHPRAFDTADASPDAMFWGAPGHVSHLDDGAAAAVTQLYRTVLPEHGTLLDLMSSRSSHLPEEMIFTRVIGHGLVEEELAANGQLDEFFVRDLNADPSLPLASESLDAACCCASISYLRQPVAIFRELARVLHATAPLVITFSDRFFPSKAVAIWQALDGEDRTRLVSALLARAGFTHLETGTVPPPQDDPDWRDTVHAIVARRVSPEDPEREEDDPA